VNLNNAKQVLWPQFRLLKAMYVHSPLLTFFASEFTVSSLPRYLESCRGKCVIQPSRVSRYYLKLDFCGPFQDSTLYCIRHVYEDIHIK
jgi:hypothetical protein